MEETYKEREERYRKEMASAVYEYLTEEYRKPTKEEREENDLSSVESVLKEVNDSNN